MRFLTGKQIITFAVVSVLLLSNRYKSREWPEQTALPRHEQANCYAHAYGNCRHANCDRYSTYRSGGVCEFTADKANSAR